MERGTFKLSPASEKILSTVRPDLQKVIRRAAEHKPSKTTYMPKAAPAPAWLSLGLAIQITWAGEP
jgi:hypothetical protein